MDSVKKSFSVFRFKAILRQLYIDFIFMPAAYISVLFALYVLEIIKWGLSCTGFLLAVIQLIYSNFHL